MAALRAAVSGRIGISRRVFSTFPFSSPAPAAPPQPAAEPSTNLFVSELVNWIFGEGNREGVNKGVHEMIQGLSKRTTSEGLREAFMKFGQVVHARVVTDRVSGYSKGFGFVRYATLEDAAEGIKGMDGKFLDGWVIFAEYARPRSPPLQTNGTPQSGFP